MFQCPCKPVETLGSATVVLGWSNHKPPSQPSSLITQHFDLPALQVTVMAARPATHSPASRTPTLHLVITKFTPECCWSRLFSLPPQIRKAFLSCSLRTA